MSDLEETDLRTKIDRLVENKINKNKSYLRFSYFEVIVNSNINAKLEKDFVRLASTKLNNMNYVVYKKGEEFIYDNAHRKVETNELLIAIKRDDENGRKDKTTKHR